MDGYQVTGCCVLVRPNNILIMAFRIHIISVKRKNTHHSHMLHGTSRVERYIYRSMTGGFLGQMFNGWDAGSPKKVGSVAFFTPQKARAKSGI